jgi:hypothetical protein
MKERVADDYFDPLRWAIRKVTGGPEKKKKASLPVIK